MNKLDFRSLLEGLKRSGSSKSLETGKQLHLAAAESGFIGSNFIIATAVLDMYSKCGSLGDARKLFDSLPAQDLVTWNIIILAHAEHGEPLLAMNLFRRMQLEGLKANGRTFSAMFSAISHREEGTLVHDGGKRFIRLTCLQQGMAAHSLAAESGWDSDIFVGTSLVDMYGRCGSLLDARASFDRMNSHDSVAWNALILGYVENGSSELALKLFHIMLDHGGYSPSEITFAAALKACSNLSESETGIHLEGKLVKLSSLNSAGGLHRKMLDSGFRVSESGFLGNSLVDLYGKCGSLLDAERVFDRIINRDVVSWTAMLFAYAENGEEEKALDIFSGLLQRRVLLNEKTFLAALTACFHLAGKEPALEIVGGAPVKMKSLAKSMEIHSNLADQGFEHDLFLASSLIELYTRCGSFMDARVVFDRMREHDVVVWTSLISGYSKSGEARLAIDLFTSMKTGADLRPDSRAVVAALAACSTLADQSNDEESRGILLEQLRKLEKLAGSDLIRKSFVANSLIDAYSRCSGMRDAVRVFETLSELRDVVSYTILLLGFVRDHQPEAALELFGEMIGLSSDVQLDSVVLCAALRACGELVRQETGKMIIGELHRLGIEACGGDAAASMVEFYGRCGDVAGAELVIDQCRARDIRSWNSIMGAYAKQGNAAGVMRVVNEMKERGIEAGEMSMVFLLSACSHGGMVEKGKELFVRMEREFGVAPSSSHYVCMIDLLGRACELGEAVDMAERMVDLVSSGKEMGLKMSVEKRRALLGWMSVLGACSRDSSGIVDGVGEVAFQSVMEVDEKNSGAYNLMANIYAAQNHG